MSSTDSKSKAEIIEERRAALPLPEEPPVTSDFNSASSALTGSGSGSISDPSFSRGNDALRGPATGESAARSNAASTNLQGQGVGREAEEGGIPNDAVARGSKDKEGLKDTTK